MVATEAREWTILERAADAVRQVNGQGPYWADLRNSVEILDAVRETSASGSLPVVVVTQQSISPGVSNEVLLFEILIDLSMPPAYAVDRSVSLTEAILRTHNDVLRALRLDRGLEGLAGDSSPLWAGPNSNYLGSSFRDPESNEVISGFSIRWSYMYSQAGLDTFQ